MESPIKVAGESHKDEFLKQLRYKIFRECAIAWKQEAEEKYRVRRAKKKAEREKVKENIRKQKKLWEDLQSRKQYIREKETRNQRKARKVRRKNSKRSRRRVWLKIRIFNDVFWVRPRVVSSLLLATKDHKTTHLLLSLQSSKVRTRRKRKKSFENDLATNCHGSNLKETD